MEVLTRKLFEYGCQFQLKSANEKSPLYVTEHNSLGNLILIDHEFACEYGRNPWINVSAVFFITDEYFVFQYKVLGEIEMITRYFNQYQVVNFKKHKY